MQEFAERYQPWLAYPVTLLAVLLLHIGLLAAGTPLSLSANLPVFAAAALVTWLELRFPHAETWRPAGSEVGQDALFMVTVQMVLPKVLALAVVLVAADALGPQAPFAAYWPHHIPLFAQAVLMVLGADFLRYWLHRFAHWHPLLWRLHAVHHSPERLYWLNVGRFHPLEKLLQFLLDTLPFVLLGVGEQVIALYFVFYAVNGFFQHSNIRLRYGVLNYLISGAELHRWHHSRLPAESNRNFGNNIILWDLLFGTWFLPTDRAVDELGLKNRNYPRSFWQQLSTPFTPALAEEDVPLQGARILGRRLFLWLRMQWVRVARWWPLRIAALFPEQAQRRVLRRLLKQGRTTRFGREHGFARIESHLDYVRHMPIQGYESLRPFIEAQDCGEPNALTPEMPFMYAVTSGTTGAPKFLPVTQRTLRQYRAGQQIATLLLYQDCPAAFQGFAFGVASAAVEGQRPSGLPYGSVSGHLYASMPRLVRQRYVVPAAVSEITDYALKYRVMLHLALATPEITYLAGANPSTFLRLLVELNESRELLAQSLEQGSLAPLGEVPDGVQFALAHRLQPEPARAAQLRAHPLDQEFSFAQLWPDIALVTVWTGGSCGVALAALRARLPEQAQVVELGYLASEMRATVTVDAQSGAGLPLLNQHFFEFIERADFEAERPYIRLLHELKPGYDYYVIVTTASGLYRYFMNDIVRVVGRFGLTPTLRFMQKGRGATNITGEKLYEHQVLQAVSDAAEQFGFMAAFVMALADEADSCYRVFLEPESVRGIDSDQLEEWLDTRLGSLNLEYQTKRASGRLDPLRLALLAEGAGEAYRKSCLQRGQREGQFKTIALQSAATFDFPLDQYVVRHA